MCETDQITYLALPPDLTEALTNYWRVEEGKKKKKGASPWTGRLFQHEDD